MTHMHQDRMIWSSADVDAFRGFEYYRDGICRSFMDLIPEPEQDENWLFSGSVETVPIGYGRLNRVVATSHLVLRTKAEIARSPSECFYLNYKTRGECRVRQSGEEIVIVPGDVGLFDSTKPFALEHRHAPDLAVSSFMLPFDDLRERLPRAFPIRPLVLSANPVFGALIREACATLARDVDYLAEEQRARLFEMLLDLVAMAASADARPVLDARACRADALLLTAKSYICDHFREGGLTAQDVAGAQNISVRYLHKLFERSGQSFGEYLLERRLEAVASALRAPGRSHQTIAAIALTHGFGDPAHLHRAFKLRFGCTPGD